MNKFNPCWPRRILLTFGLGLGLVITEISGCLGLAVGNTSLSVQSRWQLSFPSPTSLLNPGNILPKEPALTGLFLLNGGRAWSFASGGRVVFDGTVQLRLDGNDPELRNRLNELFLTLNPADNLFLDLGKQVVATGVGYFLNPAGLWPEQASFRQDRTAPPEGKVLLRGVYFFPHLTMEVGWAPPLKWAEDEGEILWKYVGSPQESALTWAMVSSGFAGVDISGLFSYGGQWKAGLSLAKVWGDRLATHCAIGWEERDESHTQHLNKIYRVLVAEETGDSPPPIEATTAKGSLKALVGGYYTLTGGENLIVEYFFNGSGLTRREWERVLAYLSTNAMLASEAHHDPLVAARLQTATAFLTEAGLPGLLRHYALARFYKEFAPTLAWEQIIIQNLVDRSGLGIFLLRFERALYSLTFGVQMPYGKKASEFGLLTGDRQVLLQINVGF